MVVIPRDRFLEVFAKSKLEGKKQDKVEIQKSYFEINKVEKVAEQPAHDDNETIDDLEAKLIALLSDIAGCESPTASEDTDEDPEQLEAELATMLESLVESTE